MPWIRLLRLRLLPSALCDILCGAALAGGVATGQIDQLLTLLCGSGLLYLSGMVWNDVADADRDRRMGVSRPIADGLVSKSGALLLAIVLMVSGLVLLAGETTRVLALAMALGILLYDFLGSRHPGIGGPLLGAIRAGNLSLGMIGMGSNPEIMDLMIPLAYGIYIACIVWHGSLEERPDSEVRHRARVIRWVAAPLPLPSAPWLAYPWLLALAAAPQLWLVWRYSRQSETVTAAGTGLMLRGISRFTAALCLGTGEWVLAACCLTLAWLLPALLGRARWS